jgi:Ala-tRNA(Pro) deacylase
MPSKTLKEFLDQEGVKYVTIIHSTAYTAQEVAASAHIKGKELAKTVMVKLDGRMAMAVCSASCKIDFDMLKDSMSVQEAELAEEKEFKDMFPGCEIGAMPPFGNLYNLPVYVSEELSLDEEIAFNAGTHRELVKLAYLDFERLVNPLKVKWFRKSR